MIAKRISSSENKVREINVVRANFLTPIRWNKGAGKEPTMGKKRKEYMIEFKLEVVIEGLRV